MDREEEELDHELQIQGLKSTSELYNDVRDKLIETVKFLVEKKHYSMRLISNMHFIASCAY